MTSEGKPSTVPRLSFLQGWENLHPDTHELNFDTLSNNLNISADQLHPHMSTIIF